MQNNETLAWNNENLNKSHHRSNSWSCSNFQPISWLLLKNPVSSIIHMPLLLVESYRISTENLIDACNPRLISNSKAYTGERKKKKNTPLLPVDLWNTFHTTEWSAGLLDSHDTQPHSILSRCGTPFPSWELWTTVQ